MVELNKPLALGGLLRGSPHGPVGERRWCDGYLEWKPPLSEPRSPWCELQRSSDALILTRLEAGLQCFGDRKGATFHASAKNLTVCGPGAQTRHGLGQVSPRGLSRRMALAHIGRDLDDLRVA